MVIDANVPQGTPPAAGQNAQRHYGAMSTSTSSKSLNNARKGSMADTPAHQSTADGRAGTGNRADTGPASSQEYGSYGYQYVQEPQQAMPGYSPGDAGIQGNSIESLNFAQLSLNDDRQRRPSQPASSFTSPASDIRGGIDSRAYSNASPYSQHQGTPASIYAEQYTRQHSHTPQSQYPAYAQRLSYEQQPQQQGGPDRTSSQSDKLYSDPSQQVYDNNYRHSDPSAYAASTSQQPYGQGYSGQSQYGDPANQVQQLQEPYYYQGQQPYFDPGAGQGQYSYDSYGGEPSFSGSSYNGQVQQYPAGGQQYSGHVQQAFAPPQQYGTDYGFEGPRAASGSSSHASSSTLPSLNRNKTTISSKSSLSAAADKDRNSQPITKQAVDDYRNRIKSDPDPETQFNFARFLIEAARRLAVAAQQGSVEDAKSVKKYRDSLLQEAIKLIKRLATQGSGLGKPAYADAQFFLANCLGHGALGLNVDHEKAYNLYVQASKQNHPAATYRTAVCNEVGAGTRRDAARAVLFYRKASALGDTAGMYKLGMILLNGLLGQQKNPREAVIWLKKAAAQADEENPHALHELGVLYEKQTEYMQNGQPIPSPVMRDEAQAREFYTQAAQLGHPPSQYKLGGCYEYGSLTCPVDPRRSIAWYTRAAEKGHAESELALSGWYLTGSPEVLKQSDSEAYLWARRAANKGLSKAEYAVGYYSEIGIGVKGDLDEAKMWYLRAAASGNRRAMQRLSELKKLGNRKAQQGARPTRQQAEKECIIM